MYIQIDRPRDKQLKRHWIITVEKFENDIKLSSTSMKMVVSRVLQTDKYSEKKLNPLDIESVKTMSMKKESIIVVCEK